MAGQDGATTSQRRTQDARRLLNTQMCHTKMKTFCFIGSSQAPWHLDRVGLPWRFGELCPCLSAWGSSGHPRDFYVDRSAQHPKEPSIWE